MSYRTSNQSQEEVTLLLNTNNHSKSPIHDPILSAKTRLLIRVRFVRSPELTQVKQLDLTTDFKWISVATDLITV